MIVKLLLFHLYIYDHSYALSLGCIVFYLDEDKDIIYTLILSGHYHTILYNTSNFIQINKFIDDRVLDVYFKLLEFSCQFLFFTSALCFLN